MIGNRLPLPDRVVIALRDRVHPVSVTVLARALGVERSALDRALSELGPTRVRWSRIGRGGDRFYELRT